MTEELLPCPFETKINKSSGCWEWTGAIQGRGYGNYRSRLAHRVSYEKYVGKIPAGMTIDHICRNRKCVNPEHLRVMSQYDNNMVGQSPTAINKNKDVCVNNHPLTGDHIKIITRKDGVRRKCMLCQKIYRDRAQPKYKRVDLDIMKEPATAVRIAEYTQGYGDGFNKAIDLIKSKYGDLYAEVKE